MRKLTMPELNRLSLTEYQQVEKIDVVVVLDNVQPVAIPFLPFKNLSIKRANASLVNVCDLNT